MANQPRFCDNGGHVSGPAYDVGHLFHTVYRAVGIKPEETVYKHNGQALAIAREDMEPMKGVMA